MLWNSIMHEYVPHDIMVYAIKFLGGNRWINEVQIERCLPFNSLFNDYTQGCYLVYTWFVFRKPACSSLNGFAISSFILSMILLRSILHGIDSRVIPLKLLHCPLHQSSCICSSFQILFSNFVYAGNWQLIAPGGMLSMLPALPVFRFLMTLRSSVFVLCDLAGSNIYDGPAS